MYGLETCGDRLFDLVDLRVSLGELGKLVGISVLHVFRFVRWDVKRFNFEEKLLDLMSD